MHFKALCLFAVVCWASAHDLIVGINNGGMKIYDENKEASPAIWRQVNNITVNATDGDVISRIVVTDLRAEKDGEAKIVEGGEGHNNVTIELKSPTALRGYQFHVEIYSSKDLNSTSLNGAENAKDSDVDPKSNDRMFDLDPPEINTNEKNEKHYLKNEDEPKEIEKKEENASKTSQRTTSVYDVPRITPTTSKPSLLSDLDQHKASEDKKVSQHKEVTQTSTENGKMPVNVPSVFV